MDRFEDLLKSMGNAAPSAPPAEAEPNPHDVEGHQAQLARAAEDAASAASLQRMAAEISWLGGAPFSLTGFFLSFCRFAMVKRNSRTLLSIFQHLICTTTKVGIPWLPSNSTLGRLHHSHRDGGASAGCARAAVCGQSHGLARHG